MKKNQYQKIEWESINKGYIGIDSALIVKFRVLSKKEFENTDFGYPLFYYPENIENSDSAKTKYLIPYDLTLLKRGKIYNGSRIIQGGFLTMNECLNYLKNNILDTIREPVIICKRFKFNFELKNKGKTVIKKINASCYTIKENGSEEFIMKNPVEWQLNGGEQWWFYVDAFIPLDAEIPQVTNYTLKLSYENVFGEIEKKEIPILWSSRDDRFRYFDP